MDIEELELDLIANLAATYLAIENDSHLPEAVIIRLETKRDLLQDILWRISGKEKYEDISSLA